jgi:electron transport complex protein RnfC
MQNSFDDIIEKLDNHELWDFPGGVFPAERKILSNQTPIQRLSIPERLYVTVKQQYESVCSPHSRTHFWRSNSNR